MSVDQPPPPPPPPRRDGSCHQHFLWNISTLWSRWWPKWLKISLTALTVTLLKLKRTRTSLVSWISGMSLSLWAWILLVRLRTARPSMRLKTATTLCRTLSTRTWKSWTTYVQAKAQRMIVFEHTLKLAFAIAGGTSSERIDQFPAGFRKHHAS